jgi:hypothetical protein
VLGQPRKIYTHHEVVWEKWIEKLPTVRKFKVNSVRNLFLCSLILSKKWMTAWRNLA